MTARRAGTRLSGLTDPAAISERLAGADVPASARPRLAGLFAHAADALAMLIARGSGAAQDAGVPHAAEPVGPPDSANTAEPRATTPAAATDPSIAAFFVPGRIEVLGKHVDYGGGRSLLAAIDRGICLVASPRADDRVRMVDARSGESAAFRVIPDLEPGAGWANYPMTVARRVARDLAADLPGGSARGVDIAFAGDLPQAQGLSSSSALVIATFLALSAVNDLGSTARYRRHMPSAASLAGYLAAVESGADYGDLRGDRGVGTHGGGQDHTAILCARPNELVRYGFEPVRFERAVPMPPDHTFVVACSGVRAEKTGAARAAYNRAAARLRAAADIWRATTGRSDATVGAALAADAGAADRLRAAIRSGTGPDAPHGTGPDALLARVEQFIAESEEIVPAACDALAEQDLEGLGRLVDRSQRLAERGLGNQIDETVHLARTAREHGAAAASAFGAGFGGSVWALVARERADAFVERWRTAYHDRFGEGAAAGSFFVAEAGPPASRIA